MTPTLGELVALADRCGVDVRPDKARDRLQSGTWADPVPVLYLEADCGSVMVRATGPEDAVALLLALGYLLPVLRHWSPEDPAVCELGELVEAQAAAALGTRIERQLAELEACPGYVCCHAHPPATSEEAADPGRETMARRREV